MMTFSSRDPAADLMSQEDHDFLPNLYDFFDVL